MWEDIYSNMQSKKPEELLEDVRKKPTPSNKLELGENYIKRAFVIWKILKLGKWRGSKGAKKKIELEKQLAESLFYAKKYYGDHLSPAILKFFTKDIKSIERRLLSLNRTDAKKEHYASAEEKLKIKQAEEEAEKIKNELLAEKQNEDEVAKAGEGEEFRQESDSALLYSSLEESRRRIGTGFVYDPGTDLEEEDPQVALPYGGRSEVDNRLDGKLSDWDNGHPPEFTVLNDFQNDQPDQSDESEDDDDDAFALAMPAGSGVLVDEEILEQQTGSNSERIKVNESSDSEVEESDDELEGTVSQIIDIGGKNASAPREGSDYTSSDEEGDIETY